LAAPANPEPSVPPRELTRGSRAGAGLASLFSLALLADFALFLAAVRTGQAPAAPPARCLPTLPLGSLETLSQPAGSRIEYT
jgi:hypothetical protein